jgi:hypothetical protein
VVWGGNELIGVLKLIAIKFLASANMLKTTGMYTISGGIVWDMMCHNKSVIRKITKHCK